MAQGNIYPEEKAGGWPGAATRGGREMRNGSLTVQTGQWTSWENIEHRKLTWKDLWVMEGSQISFIIRATYDVLPTPKNLNQWLGEDPSCALCQTPGTLRHILTGCKTSLSQGRYTWRHNQVLRQLAITLEERRSTTNALPPPMPRHSNTTTFVKAGQLPIKPSARVETTILDSARDWRMLVDLDKKLVFPPEIITTNLRPDLVLWSTSQKSVFIVELTVPWEAAVGEAYERKQLKYADVAAEAEQRGWRTQVLPVEVGCRGFVATSTTKLLKRMGVRGQCSAKPSSHCQKLQSEAATGFGSRERTPTGLQNEYGGVKAEGGTPGTPGVAVELSGGVVGLSMKHR
ncbi:uncharacterized protein LOC125005378 [Mugil cephalus]|uniref:uncharacterized protein LOC125005378 n=1 Tax=Mugil cephalus TaxID=48193 RepID=UPI001FB7818C|nr:uncharacterized protein LOC125005378 [Mugil cephalus]